MKVFLLVLALMSSPPYMCGIPEDADNQQPPTANHENSRPTAKPIAQQQTDERQRENENPNSRIERFLSFSKDNRDVIDVVSAAIVAVFTGVLTLCTVVIWLSEKKRSERELRAYISVTGVIVKALHFNDGYIEAKIDIKNGGKRRHITSILDRQYGLIIAPRVVIQRNNGNEQLFPLAPEATAC